MGLWGQFKEALFNLLSAKLRSILAILGILVGTASVVALITTSELATTHALAQFKTLGTHLLSVSISSQQGDAGGGGRSNKTQLTLNDVNEIQSSVKGIQEIAPYITEYKSIIYGGKTYQGSVIGATQAFARVAKVYVDRGRFVKLIDRANLFCVIGSKLAQKLKQQGMIDPIGRQIRLGDWYFTIAGIVKPWQPNMFVFIEMDNSVIVPIEAAYLLSDYASINNLLIKLKPEANLKTVQDQVQNKITEILASAQINIRNPEEIIKLMTKQQQTFTWLLGAIGGISLLVGGIGVMNIMLVSVIERRREIGIRLAIGARQRNILLMFLIESVMLTLFGGLLGIAVGLTVSYVVSLEYPTTIHHQSVANNPLVPLAQISHQFAQNHRLICVHLCLGRLMHYLHELSHKVDPQPYYPKHHQDQHTTQV